MCKHMLLYDNACPYTYARTKNGLSTSRHSPNSEVRQRLICGFVVNPKREWHDGQRQIMGTKNYIIKKQPLTWCCVKRACVSVTRRCLLEFAFGRLGGTTTHASWLARWTVAFWLARARVAFWRAREQKLIARAQGLAAVCRRLLQFHVPSKLALKPMASEFSNSILAFVDLFPCFHCYSCSSPYHQRRFPWMIQCFSQCPQVVPNWWRIWLISDRQPHSLFVWLSLSPILLRK